MLGKGTTRRTIRVEDELWDPAKDKAEQEDRNLSDIIREALRAYLNSKD